MKSVDEWLSARPDPADEHPCLTFVGTAWQGLTGEDIRERLSVMREQLNERNAVKDIRGFVHLKRPASPCLAFMRRRRTMPHIGIYLRGRILHMREPGPIFQLPSLAGLPFDEIRYYR